MPAAAPPRPLRRPLARPRALALVVALAAASAAPAAPQGLLREDVVSGLLGRRLDRAVLDLDPGFWGCVLVSIEGRPVLAKGYGLADRARRPNTPGTLFDLAGVSKTFTAAAALKLAMVHALELDDRLGRHLPDVPPDKYEITVRHLLEHTSGLDPAALPPSGHVGREQAVAAVLAAPLLAAPGTRFEAGDADDVLLAAVIEFASGEPFERYLERQVFRVVGMRATGFVGERDHDPARSSRRTWRADGRIHDGPVAEGIWDWTRKGATGVVTSAAELLLWVRALQGDRLIDEKRRKLFFEPGPFGTALGWYATELAGKKRLWQGGATEGYRARLALHPADDVAVAVMTDRGDVERLEARLSNLALASVRGADLETLAGFAGLYSVDGKNRLHVVVEDDVLFLVPEGTEATAMLFYADRAIPGMPGALAAFERDGLAHLERVAGRDEPRARPAFVSDAATRAGLATWAALVDELGAPAGLDWIGSSAGRELASFARSRHERGEALLRLLWTPERKLERLERWEGPLPHRVAFTPLSQDELAARNIADTGELRLRFLFPAEPDGEGDDEDAPPARRDDEAPAPPIGLELVARVDPEEDAEPPLAPPPAEGEAPEEEEFVGVELRALRVERPR